MEDENKIETAEEASLKARRKFLKTAASIAVTAPAVTLLLSAGATKSFAGVPYSVQKVDPCACMNTTKVHVV